MGYILSTKISWAQTMQELGDAFDKWGVREWTTNYPRGARLSGYSQSEADRTVTLSYTKNDKQINLQMGKQARAVDNLRVLYLAIDAMRMNEKRGLSEVLVSAYVQLSAGRQKRSPYEVLHITPDAPLEVAEAAYKARARVVHPDMGGSSEEIKELNEAIEEIRNKK